MRIAVIGAGGVGGYFGGRLAAAGEDVTFLARGRHLEAIRRDGLVLLSESGNLRLFPAKASDNAASVGPVDLVVVAVKAWDTESALGSAPPLLGPGTRVVSFQNGVEAVDAVSRTLGADRALGGVAYIAAAIEAPGVIRHTGTLARLRLGRPDGGASDVAEAFAAACNRAGLEASVSRDITLAIWEKFVFLASLSGMAALARLPVGPIRENPETRELLRRAMAEAAAVGRAGGIALPEDVVERQMGIAEGLPAGATPSMLHDLANGNRLELPWLSGAVARMGAESGVPAPTHAFIAAILGLHAKGSPHG